MWSKTCARSDDEQMELTGQKPKRRTRLEITNKRSMHNKQRFAIAGK